MATITVKKDKKPAGKVKDTVGKIKNLDDHPFFEKKAKEAKAFLQRHGLPESLTKGQGK